MKALTTEEFINKAKLTHGEKYDYSIAIYVGCKNKIKIICPISEHGIFFQTPDLHIRSGCPKCGSISTGDKQISNSNEFIRKAILIHGNKYNYSKVIYLKSMYKVKIICPKHCVFEQTPNGHLDGKGCKKCSSISGGIYREKQVMSLLKRLF